MKWVCWMTFSDVLPGHADIADTVGQVAVTGEALLHGPLWSLTAAAQGPGGQ